jgi:hypothetical protein
MRLNTFILADRPQPIAQTAGMRHDPEFGPITPVWYGEAMYVEVRGSKTGIDLDVVVYAKNRLGQFRPQTRLALPRTESHAAAVAWVTDWLTTMNQELAA